MQIDPRLHAIDDCMYRVAVKALIIQDDRVLLVKETPEMWWGIPGGGINHGENIKSALYREINEEIGVPEDEIASDFQLVYFNIGHVVNGIPRTNMFFKISLPKKLIAKTNHATEWNWFTSNEFMELNMSPSFDDRQQLANAIFNK